MASDIDRDFKALQQKLAKYPTKGQAPAGAPYEALGISSAGAKAAELAFSTTGINAVFKDFYFQQIAVDFISQQIPMPQEVRDILQEISDIDTEPLENIIEQLDKINAFFGLDVEFDPAEFLTELGIEASGCN